MGRPKGSSNRLDAGTLEQFALRVERTLQKGQGTDALEKHICRFIVSEDEKVAAAMAAKLVEWRYGKPKQPVVGDKDQPIAVLITTNLDLK